MTTPILNLHIERPGTPYTNPDGSVTQSQAGHAWFELQYPDGTSLQAGFGPENPKSGLSSVPGKISREDGRLYGGDPAFTRSLKITNAQADKLAQYRNDPSQFGFDIENYRSVENSCVDFLWKGLKEIGMNPGGNEGNFLPMDNIDALSKLFNPEFPDGGKIKPERPDDGPLGLLNGAAVEDPWDAVLAAHAGEGDDLTINTGLRAPCGSVTIGPLGIPLPSAVLRQFNNFNDAVIAWDARFGAGMADGFITLGPYGPSIPAGRFGGGRFGGGFNGLQCSASDYIPYWVP